MGTRLPPRRCSAAIGIAVLLNGLGLALAAWSDQPATRQRVRVPPPAVTAARALPDGFNDDDDDSSVPFLVSEAEAKKLGIRPKTQVFTAANPAVLAALSKLKPRATPVYEVRIHAIRTADDDGTNSATITPQQIQALVGQANLVFYSAGVRFVFDPVKDFEHRQSTLLNRDWSKLQFTGVLSGFESACSPQVTRKIYDAERNKVAGFLRGKLVVFFRYGTSPDCESPATGGYAGAAYEFVAMPRKMPEKNLLAHQLGHYFHLRHTFRDDLKVTTVDEAALAITQWLEKQQLPAKHGLTVFDGDQATVTDTPPDARGGIFISRFGEGANCDPKALFVPIPVKFAGGYVGNYNLQPDRLNIMSAFKHCHNLGTHSFSKQQIASLRSVLTEGERKHLPQLVP